MDTQAREARDALAGVLSTAAAIGVTSTCFVIVQSNVSALTFPTTLSHTRLAQFINCCVHKLCN